MADRSPEVRDALTAQLSRYREARSRWPLWTYRRTAPTSKTKRELSRDELAEFAASTGGDWSGNPLFLSEALETSPAWTGSENWPQRLQFAPRRAVFAVLEDLVDGRQPGWTIHLALDRRPLLVQARILATFAATAAGEIPDDVSEIEVPERWHRQAHLDDRDREELERAATFALFSRWTRPDWPHSEQRSGFEHLVEASVQTGRDPEDREDPWRENPAEVSRRLLADLLDRIGVPLRFRGSSPRRLPPGHLLRLEREAREIAAAVRTWSPDDRGRERALALLTSDPDTAEEHHRLEAVRRGRVRPEDDPARLLRFPFLTASEIRRVFRDVSDGDVEDGLAPEDRVVKRAGRHLLLGRLLRVSSLATLEKELSEARQRIQ